MHDAAAATQVVYYASKKTDGNAMHYEHHRQQDPGIEALDGSAFGVKLSKSLNLNDLAIDDY